MIDFYYQVVKYKHAISRTIAPEREHPSCETSHLTHVHISRGGTVSSLYRYRRERGQLSDRARKPTEADYHFPLFAIHSYLLSGRPAIFTASRSAICMRNHQSAVGCSIS
jgi:hypothetical protein